MFNAWPQLKYHKTQRKVWTSKERFLYLPCGRQSGKTELALRRLIRYLPVKKDWPDPRYFYGSPTFGQAKATAWQRLLNLTPPNWISSVSTSELTIRTIFGSELFLFGFDRPHRIEGRIIDGGIIDECSDIKPKTFDLSILPTLVWRNGWTWFIGVPKRFGVGAVEYRERYEAAAAGELADSIGYSWPSEGIVPTDYLEMCRKRMDPYDFDEQFNAKWLSASGGVFHAFDPDYNVRPCSYNPGNVIIVGSDYNVDPMCWVLCHRRGGTLEVFDELFIRNTNTEATLKILLNRYPEHRGGFQFYGDASSRARKTSATMTDYVQIASNQELKDKGRTLHYDRSNPPVADRFAVTNARICSGDGQRHIFIDEKCEHLIRDLKVRSYKPGTREVDDVGDIGHSTDALGYILWKLWPLQLQLTNNQIITIRTGTK